MKTNHLRNYIAIAVVILLSSGCKRLSQNRVEMASFVLFQIEVIWIFLKKRSLQTYFFHSNCFLLV